MIKASAQLLKKHRVSTPTEITERGCNVYASKKNGRRISDLPSFDHHQKVANTGVKHFYLSDLTTESSQKSNKFTVSTRSIQTMMQETRPKGKEVKASRGMGCFCF